MLEIVPMTLREANAFVEQNHRHHGATVGHKFSIGLSDGEKIVGVAIVGRPVSRHLDDGWTLEVNRLCTDGTRNACSMLYAAAWRAARAMGYKRVSAEEALYRIQEAVQVIRGEIAALINAVEKFITQVEEAVGQAEPKHRRRKRQRERAALIERRYMVQIRHYERAHPFRRVYKPP